MSKKPTKIKTWKDAKDATKAKKAPLSFYKALKSFLVYLKYSILLAFLICICFGGYVLYKSEIIDDYIYNDSQKFKNFIFKKDKNITAMWLYKFTEISTAMPLDSIDIFDIKTRIEGLKQVEAIKIEKIYPDSLKIEIEEKDYIAKTYHQGKLLIMSSKGEFYEPICFSQESLVKLVELTNLKIEMQDNIYLPFEKAPQLHELLDLASKTEGINFESWQKINMQKVNYLVEPLVEIYTIDDIKIVFALENYKEQLLKLKSTLDFSINKDVKFEQIDLSLKDRADVKIKK